MLIEKIKNYLLDRYDSSEYPVLVQQFTQWSRSRPLQNVKILDGTPVFTNTLLKYINLLAAGADLYVGYCDDIPFDKNVVDFLQSIGVKTLYNYQKNGDMDVILDCNAVYRDLQPRCGFAELTRSGAYRFADSDKAVINVDDSRIKAIETCLGTGESFLRALAHLNYDIKGKNIVVMGCGKVGSGIVYYAARAGANVIAVDDPAAVKKCIGGTLISCFDRNAVLSALQNCYCAVSCTGRKDALNDAEYARILLSGDHLIANMGIENEWGNSIPADRILNHNQPLNFILPEPTLLRYIDPAMALHNAAAVELFRGNYPVGISPIDQDIHDHYFKIIEKSSLIAEELSAVGL